LISSLGPVWGAIVGALHSAGLTPDEMVEKLKSLQGSQVISINHLFSARARQRTLEEWLEANLPVKSFEDLHCPLTVVTVDVVEGEEVTIDEGPLVPALLASSAVPGMFPPVRRGEQLLADGGVIDSLSTHLAYRLGAEKVIAVDVYPPLEHENLWVDPLLAMTGLDLPFYLLGTSLSRRLGSSRRCGAHPRDGVAPVTAAGRDARMFAATARRAVGRSTSRIFSARFKRASTSRARAPGASSVGRRLGRAARRFFLSAANRRFGRGVIGFNSPRVAACRGSA